MIWEYRPFANGLDHLYRLAIWESPRQFENTRGEPSANQDRSRMRIRSDYLYLVYTGNEPF